MNFQDREAGCRRILAAVAKRWGCPLGWRFEVEWDEAALRFVLRAVRVEGNRQFEQRKAFTIEEVVQDRSDHATYYLERSVLNAYQEALRSVGKEP